ncbi:hypothetical protein RI030_09060 [Aphanizomenon flos-aquae NRERC-008]|jgi:hypothetical protein|uniref:Uncharacterized protein n=2 Tax=Aphanizomenon flos-aquae TaxID=1176 RepID=A0ABR8ISC3_APHFL|nr:MULTISPECIES: hypothetical protein [Aphanizomenon]MBO1044156.1 hypothetical protein [Aphanizomenon flos-aquae UKL13-PB]MBO1060256.1 hypothetical protein [Aphanizomenon flos-aquae CP01]MCE2904379.1 hypothetical protein [Anabaena sp. CoA2_C59]MDJ0507055.1 hypothetical protein [Nostocales cyanobacterium LE14-WE12]OBQ25811.1 MAG: hypothetical protein AN481_08330 [Aphanizomenon flos-aquae LD13]OBQ29767.1 MAG: hypothetical protein AN483_08850 [Aphanizomenon flos-aquae MDT14a]HCQ20055.1 hypothet
MLSANFTTSKTEKDAPVIDFNANWLSELSSEQAADIVGGFTLTNNTEAPRTFYNFGEKLPLQQQTLKPGESGTYPGEFLLYNSSVSNSGISPAIFKPDSSGSFSLNQSGNKIIPTDLSATGGNADC